MVSIIFGSNDVKIGMKFVIKVLGINNLFIINIVGEVFIIVVV